MWWVPSNLVLWQDRLCDTTRETSWWWVALLPETCMQAFRLQKFPEMSHSTLTLMVMLNGTQNLAYFIISKKWRRNRVGGLRSTPETEASLVYLVPEETKLHSETLPQKLKTWGRCRCGQSCHVCFQLVELALSWKGKQIKEKNEWAKNLGCFQGALGSAPYTHIGTGTEMGAWPWVSDTQGCRTAVTSLVIPLCGARYDSTALTLSPSFFLF